MISVQSIVGGGGSGGGVSQGTAVATSAVTSIDFTAPITANTKKIVVSYSGISVVSASTIALQLGDAGGIETSGYVGRANYDAGGVAYSTGFILESDGNAANVLSGQMTLTLLDAATNLWVIGGNNYRSGFNHFCSGYKALSQALTTVRLTTTTGGINFDAGGDINIMCFDS